MLNPLNILSKFIKTGNQKELNKIDKIVNQINILQKDMEVLGDDQFPKKTAPQSWRPLSQNLRFGRIFVRPFGYLPRTSQGRPRDTPGRPKAAQEEPRLSPRPPHWPPKGYLERGEFLRWRVSWESPESLQRASWESLGVSRSTFWSNMSKISNFFRTVIF